jgi:hypothetical protein
MSKWIDVITNPLGLAGFALFLAFTYLATRKRKTDEKTTMMLGGLALVALVGGLALAYRSTSNPAPASAEAAPSTEVKVEGNRLNAEDHSQINIGNTVSPSPR